MSEKNPTAYGLRPTRLKPGALAAVLRDIAAAVEAGDTFEGHLEYEAATDDRVYLASAVYRYGNSRGQGGVQVLGEFVDSSEAASGGTP